MPVQKGQVRAVPLAIPEPGEDAAERKRVLNVLAQRRYRQKRKEHIRKLEAKAVVADQPQEPPQLNGSKDHRALQEPPQSNGFNDPRALQDVAEKTSSNIQHQQCPFAAAHLYVPDDGQVLPDDFNLAAQTLVSPGDPFSNILLDDQALWDTSILLPSLPSTPLSTSRHSSTDESETWSLTPAAAAKSPPQLQPPALAANGGMAYSFPDEAYLEMTELNLLRGLMAIAKRLNVHDTVWSLTAQSPFANPAAATAIAEFNHLPVNLRPSLLQLTVPHHPIIDLLPWPSTRDRMIKILAQPPEFRPPSAASPMALLDFVYDVEDSAEGVRVSGDDPYSANNWEVGEKVFKSWWWVFDKDIIMRSNELRASRGAPLLGGSILGEVA
ncbi:hypothetical protein A1O7_01116 [Cladophialophora yegresii CBS 114405]|uniref:BZIP domain-containing protein n=1 Tax=Cladophialophora yegresii CBS 114405 TaxID=1182544 RepID=W9W9Y9_9EURO|nr:uncharacterized protein A1O7_01116 [Cladophialophora yegresii CBS 114405]EXJ64778.1 hypothetical protein A1O7_01116 [Cladophialophora yegresii CBS 114405]